MLKTNFVLLAFVCFLLPAPAMAGAGENDEFVMPSGNIKCVHGITDEYAGIYCLREQPSVMSLRYINGKVDWQDAEGDQPFMDAPPVFEYGQNKVYDDMTCASSESGISCWQGSSGFNFSRKGVEEFK